MIGTSRRFMQVIHRDTERLKIPRERIEAKGFDLADDVEFDVGLGTEQGPEGRRPVVRLRLTRPGQQDAEVVFDRWPHHRPPREPFRVAAVGAAAFFDALSGGEDEETWARGLLDFTANHVYTPIAAIVMESGDDDTSVTLTIGDWTASGSGKDRSLERFLDI
jgi:hypothetical protein